LEAQPRQVATEPPSKLFIVQANARPRQTFSKPDVSLLT